MTIRSTRRRTHTSVAPAERSSEELAEQVRILLAEAQALSARLAALNEIAATMQATLDFETLLQTLAAQARWLIDFDHSSVALQTGTQYRILQLHTDAQPSPAGEYSAHVGVIGRVLRQGHEMLLSDVVDDTTLPAGTRSGIIVPLRQAQTVVGTLNFFSNQPQAYSQDDLRVAVALALQVAVTIQNTRLLNDVVQARDELHTILESIDDSVLVVDSHARILLINRSMRKLLHVPDIDLSGRRALQLLRLTETYRPLLSYTALRPLFASWHADPLKATGGSFIFNDGRHIEWARAPLTGSAQGAVITLRDISARVKLEQMRVDLTHTLVHDLRTPLTALLFGIQLLQFSKDDKTSELHDQTIVRLETSVHQIIEHVNTILDVNKLEGDLLSLDRMPHSLASLISNELQALSPIAYHSNQTLLNDTPSDLPLIWCDIGLIRRVITNLVGNALKFAPSDGYIRIDAKYLEEDELIEVVVEDNGPGINEELRTKIFDKYVQAPGAQQRKGTGLGLFFCRLAIEAHGGTIGVRPIPNGGSTFWFRLPLSSS